MPPPSHVTILGAGLTGLTTAYRLSSRLPSTKITLIDSANRVGGWMNSQTHHLDLPETITSEGTIPSRSGDVVLESGPRSIRPKGSPGAAGMYKLISDLGLKDDLITIPKTHPSAKNRFILGHDNTLRPLSLNLFRPSALSPSLLLSLAREPFRPRRPKHIEDESVDSFLSRRFGPGIATLASAGLHGIYAASSGDLSARTVLGRVYDWEMEYGSVVGGLARAGRSFAGQKARAEEAARWVGTGDWGVEKDKLAMYGIKGGLSTLTGRLAEEAERNGVDIRLGTTVDELERTSDGANVVIGGQSLQTSHIISSLSTPHLSPLLPSIQFPKSPRTSVGVVSLVFPLPPSQIHPNGFGYLIPRPPNALNPVIDPHPSTTSAHPNPHGILGVIFDSTALPGLDTIRNITKLTIMLGGPYWSTYHPPLPIPTEDALIPMALEHLRTVFPILRGYPPALAVASLNRDCIPTYTTGHHVRTGSLHRAIKGGEWDGCLSVVGNSFAGVGVNDCVWSAEGVVGALVEGRRVTGLEAWA